METKAKLKQLLSEIENKIEIANNVLQGCPAGRLTRVISNGKQASMCVIGKGRERKRKIISSDCGLQVQLARRTVFEKQLSELKNEYDIVAKALHDISAIQTFDSRRFAIENYTWFTNKEIEDCCSIVSESDWENAPYDRFDYRPEGLKHATSRGLMVRSKSEVLIAEALYRHGLPFRYEQKYYAENKYTLSADFTIRRCDGKIFIWEHEGLISVGTYVERQRRKAELFAKLGFVPWDDLIITYDTLDGAIDLRIVESEITNRLLI